jgi:hypothetical protein
MPPHKRYPLQPLQEEIDACLLALENTMPQDRVPPTMRKVPLIAKAQRSDSHPLLWLTLIVMTAFFAWIISLFSS